MGKMSHLYPMFAKYILSVNRQRQKQYLFMAGGLLFVVGHNKEKNVWETLSSADEMKASPKCNLTFNQ